MNFLQSNMNNTKIIIVKFFRRLEVHLYKMTMLEIIYWRQYNSTTNILQVGYKRYEGIIYYSTYSYSKTMRDS